VALALTSREKKLLLACVGALVLVGTMLALSVFLDHRTSRQKQITALQGELKESQLWFNDRDFWDKRSSWLRDNMPSTESLGQAQALLLEDVENDALDLGFTVQKKNLIEPVINENFREVAIDISLRGDQVQVMSWLAMLQSPERFQSIKQIEFEIDSRAKEKTPQALCNLTLARWFKPEAGL
jgi:hypothetical protein